MTPVAQTAEPDLDPPSDAPGLPDWLVDGADLLAEPDPGPTPWLVDRLIVDQALVAAVGRWKTTKSYALLDVCVAVATGTPAFGALAVPDPGPVLYVNEESGRVALQRRLDSLTRGRAIAAESLRNRLILGANTRIKLDDPDWQQRLVELGQRLRPRLIVFDPLARMKAAARDENAQTDMAPVIEYLRTLRDETGAAVCFVHHTGHEGTRMRGSSDLESAWETRLTWKREGQSSTVDIENEHREAEPGPTVTYRIQWDGDTRTMRLDHTSPEQPKTTYDLVLEHLATHRDQRAEDVARALQIRTADVRRALEAGTTHGTTHSGASGRRDEMGRPIRDKVWNLATHQELWPVPHPDDPRTTHAAAPPDGRGSSARPVPIGTGGGTTHTDDPDDTQQKHLEQLLSDIDHQRRNGAHP